MNAWNLPLTRLSALTLAADARLTATNYTDDHIWQLSDQSGEPGGILFSTTFGLRARALRFFPRFWEGNQVVQRSTEFDTPVTLHQAYPNFALIRCAPFPGIEAALEYWVTASHTACGRIRIYNRGVTPRQIRFEWAAQLMPTSGGQPMAVESHNGSFFLRGSSGNLQPIVFLRGAQPVTGPYPALEQSLNLLPGAESACSWACAARPTLNDSLQLAQSALNLDWEQHRARLDLFNSDRIQIHTGNTDWDFAFALSQQITRTLLIGATEHLPHLSAVISRQPYQGYSAAGSGSDYNHLWNGLSALDCAYLCDLLLPGAAPQAAGLLKNFLAVQDPNTGFIDFKPGAGGQRSRWLATPILAQTAWRIHACMPNTAFAEQVFEPLLRFVRCWFSPENDRDGDGVPEWASLLQLGFEEHPVFARWQADSQGASPAWAENPGLSALLYEECSTLCLFARLLNQLEHLTGLEALMQNLRAALESSWDEAANGYRWQDRELHSVQAGDLLGSKIGEGSKRIRRRFAQPQRLLLRLRAADEPPRSASAVIYGRATLEDDLIHEDIPPARWQWTLNLGSALIHTAFEQIDRFEVRGVGAADETRLLAVDYTQKDISLLLPLTSTAISAARASRIIQQDFAPGGAFWLPFGIPALPNTGTLPLLWNVWFGRAFIARGERSRAAQLFTHLMTAICNGLQAGHFWQTYQAQDGSPSGERNALTGLAPLGLFLETLGVRILDAWTVELAGENPFPWTVTLAYRGLQIERGAQVTLITFPNGEQARVENSKPCRVQVTEEKL